MVSGAGPTGRGRGGGGRSGDSGVRFRILDNEVRVLPVRPAGRSFGALKHDGPPAPLVDMECAIAGGGVRGVIAFDANVLVRYPVDEDAEQAIAARKLPEELTSERPGFESLRRSFIAGRLCRLAD